MKERGLICKDDEVRAILDGRKTVFRRPLGPRVGVYTKDGAPDEVDSLVRIGDDGSPEDGEARCPFGVPGDRLWVREACAYGDLRWSHVPIKYRADGERQEGVWGWLPSSTMPRHMSRILLEVVSVRIERLHAITEEDARREGMDWAAPLPQKIDRRRRYVDDREDPREVGYSTGGFALRNFRELWDRHNGNRHAWSENPFVWRVEFRRLP